MSASREELLDLIVRWEESQAKGEDLALEDLCQTCPERLDEVRRHIAKLGKAAWLDRFVTSSSASSSRTNGPPLAPVELPRVLADRYRLDSLIGVGGYAWVYQAFDTWLERPIAVKVPKVDRSVDGEDVDQCRLEAKKVARLRHPHIVPVYDVGREGANCFIVSAWIDGQNLADRLKNERLTPSEAGRIASEIGDALGNAHQHGYVHRDVKPANILIDTFGQAYLTDFGIAALEEDLAGDSAIAGTLPYMAPELLDPHGNADHRADIYALGVVLYEMLTGRRPFEAPSSLALRERIVTATPLSPRRLNADVPEYLDVACLRALSRDPQARYQSAEAMIADLHSPTRRP